MNFSTKDTWLFIAILVIAGFLVYSFNLNNGLFWDDDDWIINNDFVHSLNWDNFKFWFSHDVLAGVGLRSNYYRPFLFFTFAFNWVVSGTRPFLWHLVSNAIHIANGIFVFILLRKALTTSDVRGTSDVKTPGYWIAFLTALMFTIHPLNTEAVTYISGRGDLLAAFFMFLALFLWITDRQNSPEAGDTPLRKHRKSVKWKSLSLLVFILAILSRETGIIFPFFLMVFYVAFLSKDKFIKSVKKAFFEALPYFSVVLVYGILRLTVFNFQNTLNFYTAPNLYSENLSYRLFTFMHVLVDYFRLLFVPTGLHMERSVAVHTSLFQWPVWLGAVIVLSIVAVGVLLYRKSKLITSDVSATSDAKIWLFGWGWFFVGLTMVSGAVPINAVMYEHWLYLPMIGFWLVTFFYLTKLFNFFKTKSLTTYYLLLTTALIAYFSFFVYQSIQRNILWGNPIKFYEDILRYEPGSARISNNLGNLYFNKNDQEKAEFYYRKAIESGDVFAQPHFNIGSILQSRGDIASAIKEHEKALEIDPNFYYAYQNLAVIYAQQGDFIKAVLNIEKLKLLLPNNPRVYYNSALIYIALNNREKAIVDLKEGLKYVSTDPETGKSIRELIEKLKE